MQRHGGFTTFEYRVRRVTHVVAIQLSHAKARLALKRGTRVVSPDWVFACVRCGRRLDEQPFAILTPANQHTLDQLSPSRRTAAELRSLFRRPPRALAAASAAAVAAAVSPSSSRHSLARAAGVGGAGAHASWRESGASDRRRVWRRALSSGASPSAPRRKRQKRHKARMVTPAATPDETRGDVDQADSLSCRLSFPPSPQHASVSLSPSLSSSIPPSPTTSARRQHQADLDDETRKQAAASGVDAIAVGVSQRRFLVPRVLLGLHGPRAAATPPLIVGATRGSSAAAAASGSSSGNGSNAPSLASTLM